ncbi:MAG: AMP-binding protein [Actinobacteria bacterium]|nr:AMP-binding protein [Actinomycetota bacterium]
MIEASTLWEHVEKRAADTPDGQMLVDETGRTMTFAQFRDAAERAAAGLAGLGVGPTSRSEGPLGPGDRVSWQLPTWIESVVLVAALSRLGVTQNPVLPLYRQKELGFVIRQTGAKLLIVPSEWRGVDFKAMADGIVEGTSTKVVTCDRAPISRSEGRSGPGLPEGDPATLPPPPASGDPLAGERVRWLFYTSGTTADPKGAQHTDNTILAAAKAMCERLAVTADDRSDLVFPFTHIGGICWLYAGLLTGCTNVLVEAFDPPRTTEVASREGITLLGKGTFFHQAYLAAQREAGDKPLFPDLRACPGGGAPKPPQLHYDVKSELGGVGIVSGYGLTECPILSMAAVDDPDQKLADTEGRATSGVDIKLRTVDGAAAGPGEEGELRVKAPQLFKGYLDSSLDAAAFDEEGYFRTGDLGVLDEGGYVVITGRLKDVIIRKGENISAKELEDLLYQHPKVADVAVIGLPDPASGERACAVVQPADTADALTFEEMIEFLEAKGIMRQKLPEQLEIDEIPRNPAGKVLKHELREKYAR